MSSVSVCHAQVFARFSGCSNSIHNIIPQLKKENVQKKSICYISVTFSHAISNMVMNVIGWFKLVSLFNGISTFVGYLMPKPFS